MEGRDSESEDKKFQTGLEFDLKEVPEKVQITMY